MTAEVKAPGTGPGEESGGGREHRLGRLVTHRLLGLPLFLAVVWVTFRLVTDVAAPYVEWVSEVVNGPVARWLAGLLGLVHLGGGWVESLVVDGILAGVGGVLAFVPVLVVLYSALAVLQDSGYMLRSGLFTEGVMRVVGLPGAAFLPMVMGFGCTVPAVLATRALSSRRDRVLAGLLVPFMSCGARLPVFVLMASVFFTSHQGTVVFLLYLTGIVVAVVVGAVLSRTLLAAPARARLQLEPPPLRRPRLRRVGSLMIRQTGSFVRNAGTVILAASVVVWLLLAIPVRGGAGFAEPPVADSTFAGAARLAAPLLRPMGTGSWEQAGALAGGLVAKEVIVSTLAQVTGVAVTEEVEPGGLADDLREIGGGFLTATRRALEAIPGVIGIHLGDGGAGAEWAGLLDAVRGLFEESSGGHGALAALAFMVFVLLYTPCAATLATIRRELGARWMAVSALGQAAVAFLVATLVYQVGRLTGLG
ncbi:MAG: Ferrous iron transport protein domain protein [Actinobacteria bacterium]|nr:Ferrous iron transport protein domain protein [Actinomycetota bacterium]